MIILKHLTVEQFRLLREVNLHFPQRGSILIQGSNEAGKSALLESIYFALYGEPLAAERGKRSLDDLISYGASSASVTLTLSISVTELTVTRTLERGKGQKVALYIRRLGLPEEGPITRLASANERIIAELGHMDGPTLRNSCLIEQKGLERLESLSGAERETTIRKLLGIEQWSRVTERFVVTADDERQLNEARERLRLAELQERIPRLNTRFEEIEAALEAIIVNEELEEIEQQEREIAEQEKALNEIQQRRSEIKQQMNRVHQLKTADNTLNEIITTYEAISHAQQEIPALEKQISELERREREELPTLESRVSELSDLTRSFGTLQRMSNDLLAVVDTIKDLKQELKQQENAQESLSSLKEQIAHAEERVREARTALQTLEEQRRAERPRLEARQQRLQTLSERLAKLKEQEERYSHLLKSRVLAQENSEHLAQLQQEIKATEQELAQAENKARQLQSQAEELEWRARQLSIRRQLAEWQRLKRQAIELANAEQHVHAAHQQQEQLTAMEQEARRKASLRLGMTIMVIVLCLVCALVALVEFAHGSAALAMGVGVLALLLAGGAAYSMRTYTQARNQKQALEQQMQEAVNRMGAMVAAREAARRMGGNADDLTRIEREIQNLGGSIPRSLEEATRLLQQPTGSNESLAEIQKRIQAKREEVNAAHKQVKGATETLASQRKEFTRLEEARARESWNTVDEDLRATLTAIGRVQEEITQLANQEGLPALSVHERLRRSRTITQGALPTVPLTPLTSANEAEQEGVPELETLVEHTIKATQQEIATLDSKLDLVADLTRQLKVQQEALDVLLDRKRALEARTERYRTSDPQQQIERAREQQAMLRSALQSLQDSLRQRVKPLGIVFGQAAISAAETAARKQLEELHMALAGKLKLQKMLEQYGESLKKHQEALAEHYKQLAKFSNSLGSWIVPPNPFAEALTHLRARCQHEIDQANERGLLKELDDLQLREGALRAKVALCQQEIENTQERIARLLAQRHRPTPNSYRRADLIAVWPLIGQYTLQDRTALEEERNTVEQELTALEEQERLLSQQLHIGDERLDLSLARAHLEQQERAYEMKKRGHTLVKAVSERLVRKVIARTEHYMLQLLPLLTGGRYHDLHLTTEAEDGTVSGGPLNISLWDSMAGEYVTKEALSTGTAAQLSLALRLAFAIATLPRELTAAPGFLMLDEPLSSLDRERTQALVDALTGDLISRHFEQVILVSYSGAFDPGMFPYHIYLDHGAIVESNLPVVQYNAQSLQAAQAIASRLPSAAATPKEPVTDTLNNTAASDDFVVSIPTEVPALPQPSMSS
jgi:DNA repair exonuclease SbcCD ATPase subunit